MKKKLRRFGWLIVLLLVIAAAAVVWYGINVEKKKPKFETEKVERGTITATVNTTGTVQSVISVEIGSQVSGKIKSLYVDFNSHVKKGQLLAQIDPALFQAQADEASANLESARATTANYQAQYENAVAKVKATQAAVKSAEAQVEISRANLTGAINNEKSARAGVNKAAAQLQNDLAEYKRAEELMKQNFISHTEMDAAQTKYNVSLANLDVAKATLAQASSSVKSAQMQLDSSRYNLESAHIDEESQKALARAVQAQVKQSMAQVLTASGKLREATVNLGYTSIFSPIDGVVVSRAVDVGQTVAAAFQAPKLFVIAKDLRDMEVLANVDEADIGKVKEGMKADFTVDAYQEEEFNGVIKQVRQYSTLDQGVVKYQVVMSAPNPQLKLKPGMTANVIITSEVRDNCLRIPNGAIRFRPDSVTNFPYPDKDKNGKASPPGHDTSGKPGNGSNRKPGNGTERYNTVWVFEGEELVHQERFLPGITDGKYTEMKKGSLQEGMELITGVKSTKPSARPSQRPGGGGGPRMFR